METLLLFTSDELNAAPRNVAKDSSEITLPFRDLNPEEREEAGARWARILRAELGRDLAKRIASTWEKAGHPVSVRTAQNWLNGDLASEKNLLVAAKLFGPGVVHEVYEPDSPAAAASRRARLERLVRGGAA